MKLFFSLYRLGAPGILSALCLISSGAVFAQTDSDPIVSRPGDSILFNRDCANEQYYQVRAYGILQSEDGRARALVRVSTGYFRARNPRVEIGLSPLELDFDLGPGWADSRISLQLLATAGAQAYSTSELSSYLDSDFGREPVQRLFVTDGAGLMQWRDIVEPDLAETEADEGFNVTDGFVFDASSVLPDGDMTEAVRLDLRLRQVDSDEQIVMRGPLIQIPDEIREMDLPEPRALGLLEAFNPLQEGGVINWLGRGFRYRNCIDERKQARLVFQN